MGESMTILYVDDITILEDNLTKMTIKTTIKLKLHYLIAIK
jgi:hypothetical protein